MKNVKIVFFDIDGTLLNYGSTKLSFNTIKALKDLKNKGIKIVIASGRAPMTLPDFGDIVFDAYVCFNGSLCFSNDFIIHSNSLESDDVRTIINNATNLNKAVSIATKDKLVANGVDKDLADYFKIANLNLEFSENFNEVLNEDIYQVMLGCKEAEYESIMKNTTNAKIAAWWDRAVDIIPKNGGKGLGIRKVLEFFNINKEDSMSFGDGNNDIEMFDETNMCVAMENASANLKKIAKYNCKHVAEDGIYYFLKENNVI